MFHYDEVVKLAKFILIISTLKLTRIMDNINNNEFISAIYENGHVHCRYIDKYDM